jgi:1-acyl-sn-glycerol-3-phosphate acyltransferase
MTTSVGGSDRSLTMVRPEGEARASALPASRLRIFVNRLIFRGMLFTMGTIAVVMSQLVRDKRVVWRFARTQARNLARLCGVRVRVRGLEHLGDGSCIFTPNHQSNFDIVALLGYLPGNNRFATKRELFREPILGMVLRTMGMIPIDRDDPGESIRRLNRPDQDGFSVIIFPEGTRSRDGRLLPFRKGAFVAAIQNGLPIVPIVCKGTARIMPKGGYLSIVPGEAELVILPPIATAGMGYDDREPLRDLVRQRIEEELERDAEA